jgi:hypothetical protein
MSFDDEIVASSRAASPNIYRRQVPGISDGQLANAISADQQRQQQRDEPTINSAFTQTSPSLYYRQQAHQQASSLQQLPRVQALQEQPIATWGSNPLQQRKEIEDREEREAREQQEQNEIESVQQVIQNGEELFDNRRSNSSVLADAGGGESVEQQLAAMKNSISTLTWLLVALGIVLLTLLVVVVIMVSRAYTIACTNQTVSSIPTVSSAAPKQEQQIEPNLSADSLFQ